MATVNLLSAFWTYDLTAFLTICWKTEKSSTKKFWEYAKKSLYYANKSHEINLKLIEEDARPEINNLWKQYYETDAEVLKKQLESNKLAEELRKKQQKLELITTQNHASYDYIQSRHFTHPKE